MEPRFEARKREIEQDAKLDTKDLAGAAQRLDRFLSPFFDYLPLAYPFQQVECLSEYPDPHHWNFVCFSQISQQLT